MPSQALQMALLYYSFTLSLATMLAKVPTAEVKVYDWPEFLKILEMSLMRNEIMPFSLKWAQLSSLN